MKIVHILTRLLRAGSEENTLATCKAQIGEGHDVFLLHGAEYDARHYDVPIHGLNLVCIQSLIHPISIVSDLRAVRELTSCLTALKPDVVHTHQSKAGILGRFSAWLSRVPVIIHGVHIVPFESVGATKRAAYLIAERLSASFTTAFVNVSSGTMGSYIKNGIGTPDRHHIVHSGFSLARFQNAGLPMDWKSLLRIDSLSNKPPVILMLAALEPRKRHCEFLKTFGEVVAIFPNVQLIMAGEGPIRSLIEAKISELNLQENVSIVGYRTDPECLIAMADICLLTSTREGLPRVVMQYLSGGKPCVACNLPGLDEVLKHNHNGFIVSADDVSTASAALVRLLQDRVLLARLTLGAQQSDLQSWDVSSMGIRMSAVYSRYCKGITSK